MASDPDSNRFPSGDVRSPIDPASDGGSSGGQRLTVIASTQTLARPVQLQRPRAVARAAEDVNRSVQPRFFSPDEFKKGNL